MKKYIVATFFCFFLASFSLTQAQQFPTDVDNFGKNRVQYQNFDWKYVISDNFEIYYYKGGYEMALLTARFAETEFGRLTELLGFAPYNKIKIFVYHSVGELQQSNIGINDQDFKIGGQTNLGKSVVEIAFSEYREAYRKELLREISDALLSEMMYGGNLKETLQSSFLLSLPDWFMAGASAYAAEGWSLEMDNFVRTNLLAKKFPFPDTFQDQNARLIGQSIWNFIVEEYGKASVSNILNLTRIVRSEKSGIQGTLGIEYKDFLERWENFYRRQYPNVTNTYAAITNLSNLATSSATQLLLAPRFNPTGTVLAYAENTQGKYRIFLRDLTKEKSDKFLKGGLFVINQRYDENAPLLNWRNSNEVAVLVYEKTHYVLTTYDLKGKELARYPIKNVEEIQSFDFDKSGNTIVLSATQKGKSDIFTFSLNSQKLQRITDDTNDDIDPHFLKNSSQIVFSSNRQSDSLKTTPTVEQSPYFNLFIYESASKNSLTRLTNQNAIASQPLPIDEDRILFISDELGIRHLFIYDLKAQTNLQLSTFFIGTENYDYHLGQKKLALIVRDGDKTQLLLQPNAEIKHTTFTGKTQRSQILTLRYLKELRKKNAEETPIQVGSQDTTRIRIDATPQKNTPDSTKTEVGNSTTDGYQFDRLGETAQQPTKRKRLLKDYDYFAQRASDEKKIIVRGPFEYHNKFSFERSVTTIALDPLRNFGLLLEVEMSDDLENHKVQAGLFNRGFFDIQSGMIYAEYSYLKQRIDYGARFDRQGYELFTPFFTHRYYLNKVSGIISYPLNVTTRLVGSPFLAQKQFIATSETNPAVQRFPSKITRYGGATAELVFDNSTITGPNTREGSRFRATIDHYQGLNHDDESFTNISIDARHYIPIFRKVTLAMRFAYGKSFGQKPKNFRLGGVDNWIFQRQPNPDELSNDDPFYLDFNEPLAFTNDYSDYLFLRYATPMRGFDYNKLSGNNFMLTNLELRVPVAQIFYRGTVRSPFFQNLQFVAFNDIGSAWTGISPFNKENALNTVEIGGQPGTPFYAKVSNFKDPFLWGYGVGVRSKILNYFTRFDVAWGVEDDERTSARYYLSIGYDF